MKMTCPTCAGKRTIETVVPNVKRSHGVDYVSSIQPTKTRVDVCPTCDYAGVVDDLEAIRERLFASALLASDHAAGR